MSSGNGVLVASGEKQIRLCGTATDMRLGLPGLLKKVNTEDKRGFRKGTLYVFVNHNFQRIKLFYWDRDGYALWFKHVPKGGFEVDRKDGYSVITGVNLKTLLGRRAAITK